MSPLFCPSCNTVLTAAELSEGWCESCGKKIPPYVEEAARRAAAPQRGDDAPLRPEPAPLEAAAAPLTPAKKRLYAALAAVGVLAANAVLAYALAGTRIYDVAMFILAGLIGAFVVGAVIGTVSHGVRDLDASSVAVSLLFLLFAGALIGSGFTISYLTARATVHIDNFSPHDVVLELNGKEWRKSKKGSKEKATLTRGTYTLVVRDGDKELDRRSITVDDKCDYILNVLGSGTYTRGTQDYGGFSFGEPDKKELRDHWIKADVDHLFEPAPKSITVTTRRGRSSSTSRTYLLRGGPGAPLAP